MKSQTKAKILCFMAFVSNGFTMFHDVLAGDLNSEFFRFIILSRLENLDFYIILPIYWGKKIHTSHKCKHVK